MRLKPYRLKTFVTALCAFSLVFICLHESAYTSDLPQQRYSRARWEHPEAILDTLGIRAGMVIGEVGAVSGYFTFMLYDRVGETGKIFANDISRSALSTLRERARRNGVENIEVIQGEVENTRFPPATMDMVIMVLTYVRCPRSIAFQSDRVCVIGRWVTIWAPCNRVNGY